MTHWVFVPPNTLFTDFYVFFIYPGKLLSRRSCLMQLVLANTRSLLQRNVRAGVSRSRKGDDRLWTGGVESKTRDSYLVCFEPPHFAIAQSWTLKRRDCDSHSPGKYLSILYTATHAYKYNSLHLTRVLSRSLIIIDNLNATSFVTNTKMDTKHVSGESFDMFLVTFSNPMLHM